MIRRPEIQKIVNGYDDFRVAVLGRHSALEIMDGAKDEVLEKMKSLVPINRLGKTEEYGYLVSFLSSDKAAYINGASIPIDGGLLRSY